MSSKGAPPPETEGDGSSSKASNNSPEPSPSNSDSSTPPPPPPAESESETPPAPPQPAAVIPPPAGATPVTPGVPVAGANPVNVPVQPGAITAPPPPHKAAKKSPSKHSSEGNESDTGLLIGVLAGAGLLLLLVIAIVCCACCNKRKKKKNPYGGQDQMHFYGTGGPNGGQYYNTQPQKKWQSSDHAIHVSQGGQYYNSTPPQKKWQSPEHALQIPPPVGVPMWGGQFSPHQGNHSADMSSSLSSPQSHPVPPPPPPMSLGFNKNAFTYDELASATSGFAPSNLLGQGGFGYVHKGILPNGKEIAVKSLKTGSGQGEREFQAEVEIINRVHHRHLVSLVGYCIAGGQRMLVYEFVPNNNLEFHLHGKGRPPIEWGMRLKIALGSAKGLAYLHEDCHPRIIHRDIKTANILLDYSFDAKVADFGLAKLTSDNNTHVSTRIMGTFGYLAPEYASSGKLTEKSDVYSFGVMLLELITGRRPLDTTDQMEESLVDWARPLLQRAIEEGNYDEIIDPRLEKNYVPHEVKRMVACAAASIRHSSRRRPKMSQIVRALEGDVSLDDLNDGVKPGQSTMFTSSEDSEYGNTTYTAEMRKFRKMAFESQEYQSSEYGATSEYGLNPSSSSDSGETKMSSQPPSRNL